MLSLRHFTRSLGADQPLLGVLPERPSGRFDQSRSVRDHAEQLLAAIVDVQRTGPYYLAGYSLGGNLAYEIAGILQEQGQRIAYLGLVDSGTPEVVAAHLRRLQSIRGRILRVGAQLKRGPMSTLRTAGQVLLDRLDAVLPEAAHFGPRAAARSFDWLGALRIAARHVCDPHDVPLEVFVSADEARRTGTKSLGWNGVHRGEVTVHTIAGNHQSLISEPEVQVVAETMARTLRARQAAESQNIG